MKAMILAAGLGTRLRPLTDTRPKALMQVGERTLLEITLARLCAAGVREVIVNAHHFAEMIVDYLKQNSNFGMRVEVSREPVLLDTGGGLKNAADFFLDGAKPLQPFILHNVDVISAIDLRRMLNVHVKNRALATLAVQERKSSRHLLFDKDLQLCGRQIEQKCEIVRPAESLEPLAFCGIHVISPRIFAGMTDDGIFSIIDAYLHLAAGGEKIMAFRADEYYWRDLGRPQDLAQAAEDMLVM